MAMNGRQEKLIAALDIGSSKVACLIAHVGLDNQVKVLGVGNRACNGGVAGGVVVDMEATERAIRAAVDQAEKMAGQTVSDVILSFSGSDPKSQVVEVSVDVEGHAVGSQDLDRALAEAGKKIDDEGGELLHVLPAAFAVDGNFGVKMPVGMYGKKLTVALLVLTAERGPLQNLQACVRRAHLNVVNIVHGPFAAGLSTLVDDEMKMGAACIDLGAGTTGISVFAQGSLVHAETIPVGGAQITEEIARSLLTPFDQAERLKTFNGAAIVDPVDARLEIEVQQVGEAGRDSYSRQPRSNLTSVMEKELELLFATVAKKLDASGFSGVAGKRVVLTGGGAGCEGVADLAGKILGRRVRIGKPQLLGGLPQAAQSPGFASLVGLLLYATDPAISDMTPAINEKDDETQKKTGTFGRMTRWLKENF